MKPTPFTDTALVARYATDTPRRVPGFSDLHRMAQILLAERAPENAEILVLGAGGGLELRTFAEARPGWSFVGVDPSQSMLDLAAQILGQFLPKVKLVTGYIDDAPKRPFDGATCLLTLHFLSTKDRLHTLRELNRRLKPGAPLITAHHCNPGSGLVHDWLARSALFASGPGSDAPATTSAAIEMAKRLTLLSASEEETVLQEAGFVDPTLFYAALSFRGWVAYANGR